MHRLQLIVKEGVDVNTRPAEEVYLLIKLLHIRTPLMEYVRIGYQARLKPGPDNAYAELYIFAHERDDKATHLLIYLSAKPHIEAAWMIGSKVFLFATYATGGKVRGHAVADGFFVYP